MRDSSGREMSGANVIERANEREEQQVPRKREREARPNGRGTVSEREGELEKREARYQQDKERQ